MNDKIFAEALIAIGILLLVGLFLADLAAYIGAVLVSLATF